MYAERTPPGEPPCDVCRVDISEENQESARVYHLVKRQVRTAGGSGEIIDLDYAAVKAVMDILEVQDQRTVFERVTRAFHFFLAERQQRSN